MTEKFTNVRLLMLLCALTIGACARVNPVIPYSPRAHFTRDEARSVIVRAFEEQPVQFRPLTVEIGDDAIRLGITTLKRGSLLTGGSAAVDTRETYYFANLAALSLIQRGGRWQVFLSNGQRSVRRWVIFYDQQQAVDFLDALNSLTKIEGRLTAPTGP